MDTNSCLDNKRIDWIDMAKGIAIFLVVLGHVNLSKLLNDFIYSFHMPLFFIICGLTFNKQKIMDIPVKAYIIKIFKRFVVSYFWLELLSFPLWFLTYRVFHPSSSQSFLENLKGIFISNGLIYDYPSKPVWFLLTMFLSLVGYRIILEISKNDKTKELFLVLICSLLSVVNESVALPWRVNVAPTGIVFIYIGTLIIKYLNEEEKISFKKCVFWIALFLAGVYSHYLNGRISMATNKFGKSFFLFYITAVIFSIIFFKIVKLLPNIKLLSYVGKNTLILVGFHKPIIRIIKCFINLSKKSDWINFLVAAAVFAVLIPVCALFNKFAPYVAGKTSANTKLINNSKMVVVFFASVIPIYYLLNIIFGYFNMPYAVFMTLFIVLSILFSLCFVVFADKKFKIIFNHQN